MGWEFGVGISQAYGYIWEEDRDKSHQHIRAFLKTADFVAVKLSTFHSHIRIPNYSISASVIHP
jgi:hypothetical protein